jgi:hypothetical protein
VIGICRIDSGQQVALHLPSVAISTFSHKPCNS